MFVQREGRIFSVLGDCLFVYLAFYSVWAEPRLIVLLSKIMGGGLRCHDLRRSTNNLHRSTSNYLTNSGFWYLFLMFICVDAFYLRKPGKIPYELRCHDLRRSTNNLGRSTSNFLANSGFWCLFLMFICADAFYLRKPGKISYVLFSTCACPRE